MSDSLSSLRGELFGVGAFVSLSSLESEGSHFLLLGFRVPDLCLIVLTSGSVFVDFVDVDLSFFDLNEELILNKLSGCTVYNVGLRVVLENRGARCGCTRIGCCERAQWVMWARALSAVDARVGTKLRAALLPVREFCNINYTFK